MNPLDRLEQNHFDEILSAMGQEFDSHDFIRELSSKQEQLYVKALGLYVDSDHPFAQVHSQIGKRLFKRSETHPGFEWVEETRSQNIFGYDSEAQKYRKVE